jgi:hydrogenase maturation protein HypF
VSRGSAGNKGLEPLVRPPIERRRLHVDGVVQGVGFRPYVYGLATRYGLSGWVLNTSSGVDIEVQGELPALDAFEMALPRQAPRLARIDRVIAAPIAPVPDGGEGFVIRHSQADSGTSLVPPDVSTCPDCLAELFDPSDRRYRYPFTNCTNCGPRYTIIQSLPYDRPMTTMRGFKMCPTCQAEYDDPTNRRFHAQPNACPVCGPHAWLVGPNTPSPTLPLARGRVPEGRVGVSVDDVARTAALLHAGLIVAIKGLGGFHVACDATNAEAVAPLRERKRRPAKPFAVMMASLDQIRAHCHVSQAEADLLGEPSAPIVLLYRRAESDVAPNVAPDNPMLGVMLPYTPLHHILMRDVGRPLVMTSGNLSDLPIITDNDEAQRTLSGIADAFLLHDRPIHMRCDDAVWWVDAFADAEHARQPLRRSRGDAPYPVRLPWPSPAPILATGAEMKNTLCLLRDGEAFLSQHVGEVDSLEALDYFRAVLDHLKGLFKLEPEIIACDMHPGYLTTRLARQLAADRLPLVAVQHHHAHIAACLADNANPGPVIGVAFDGTGYGDDGAIWGGEFLIADLRDYRRAAHLEYLPLPGGEAAIRRPYRIAWGYLLSALGEIPDLPAFDGLPESERHVVARQVARSLNSPPTSSAGRLFDAVAAMLGLCRETTFEAQAAIALELAAREADVETAAPYPFEVNADGVVQLGTMLAALADDIRAGRPTPQIAAAFHVTVADLIVQTCSRLRDETGLETVALSGGCFQNRLLLRLARERLRASGFEVLAHRQVPANDGGLSLGQAVIASQTAGTV